MLKWRFFENKAFWHTFAVLCISVFNISAGFHCRHYRHYRQNRQNRQRCYARAHIGYYIYNINISFPLMVSLFFFLLHISVININLCQPPHSVKNTSGTFGTFGTQKVGATTCWNVKNGDAQIGKSVPKGLVFKKTSF